tara:strand:+ start:6357 stop:6848 length:492 start_codon:yes stop_codon:yes gene_type:complete
MVTILEIIKRLEFITDQNPMLRRFEHGVLTELDIKKLGGADYPLLFADISSADIDRGTITYDVDIVVAELTVPGQTNALEQYSNTLRLLQDVVNEFQHARSSTSLLNEETSATNRDYSQLTIQMPVSCEPFTARFDNNLTGWVATFSVTSDNENNLCESPRTV